MTFGFRRGHGPLKLGPRKKLEKLAEDAAESGHKGLASKISVELVALTGDPTRGQPLRRSGSKVQFGQE
jgi:hypothetical protein